MSLLTNFSDLAFKKIKLTHTFVVKLSWCNIFDSAMLNKGSLLVPTNRSHTPKPNFDKVILFSTYSWSMTVENVLAI